jgi:hydrophobic/amphiphilic exporter-1 (mainly G- bacteria), HAE1 family
MSSEPSIQGHGFYGALVQRPVALLVTFITLFVIGVITYVLIPIQMMPDGLVEPALQVWADNPGASPVENEARVARVIEEQMRTLTGVESIDSWSTENFARVEVAFDAGMDMDLAKAEVRDRIERARPLLPESVQDVGLWSWSESDLPVMFFAILHPGDSKETDFQVDSVIRRKLESIDGVGRLEIWGALDDSMRILLDEDKVRAANLDLGELIGRLSRDNFAEPLGELEDGGRRVMLRSDMRFKTPEEIAEYPVGEGLTIGDLARVEEVKSIRNRLFKIDGRYAYYGEIQKGAQANVVATCHRVRAAFKELEADPRLRGGFSFLPLFDQGTFIETSLAQLTETAWVGGVLAVLVLLIFLRRVRLTLAVATSIPISALLAIAWLYFAGSSFNVLTMTGITLAMGMLVDNAIVVIENISRLHRDGRGRFAAAASGTREVALAVVLSTLTTVVVFLPLIFMSENPMLRIMFGALGMPFCLSVLFSLLVALVFLPVIAARLVGPRPARAERMAIRMVPTARVPARAAAHGIGGLRAVFLVFLRAAFALERALLAVLVPLRWPLALSILGFAAWRAYASLPALRLAARLPEFGAAYASRPAELNAALLFGLPALLCALLLGLGSKRWRRRAALPPLRPARLVPAGNSVLDMAIDGVQRVTVWTLKHRLAATGLSTLAVLSLVVPMSNMSISSFGQDENTNRLDLQIRLEDNFTLWEAEEEMAQYEKLLEERRERYGFAHLAERFDQTGGRFSLYWDGANPKENHDAVLADLRSTLKPKAGHTLSFGDENASARTRNVVAFRLYGPESERLEEYGERGMEMLKQVRGLHSITSPLEGAPQQVRVKLDNDLAQRLGMAAQSTLTNIAWALRGWQLPRYQEPGREIPLIIEYDDAATAGLATLRDLEIFGEGAPVPLSSFAEFEFGKGSRMIRRHDGQTSFMITARVDDPLRQKEVSDQGYALLQQLDMPRGYGIGVDDLISTRQDEEMKELKVALWLSMVLVFVLMGILFESFLLPFSVLFTIPFAVVGAFWTLFLTGTTMDSVGWIGIIILVGVVVNNGIVLIDRVHALRKEGMERSQAVLAGTIQRVRPILMTALATVFGLIPMTLAEPPSDGIDYRALATCVAGGLTVSTFFTLWIVPLAYTLFDDLAQVLIARFRWALRPLRSRPAADPQTAWR